MLVDSAASSGGSETCCRTNCVRFEQTSHSCSTVFNLLICDTPAASAVIFTSDDVYVSMDVFKTAYKPATAVIVVFLK